MEVGKSGKTDQMTSSIALRRCQQCGKAQDEQIKMKRCSRCANAVYCSKECQKKGWPAHKPGCTPTFSEDSMEAKLRHIEVQFFGFKNTDEFSQALRDFVEAHSWAFLSYIKAHLLLQGGPQYIHTPPKLMEVNLRCLCTPGSSRDPARSFQFLGHRWRTVAEYTSRPIGARNWERAAAMREDATRTCSVNPHFAGILPVLYAIEDVNAWQTFMYPQYRPLSGQAFLAGPSEETQSTLWRDVVALCTKSVNLGLALRCAEGQASVAALPGRFVRVNKLWKWEPLFTDWDKYLAGPRGIQGVDALLNSELESGVSAPLLLQLIRAL